jgi:hypothetical protein
MDMTMLARAARRQGWEVRRTRRGHVLFVSPDRTVPLIYGSGTPSDHRSVLNLRARLRRAGLAL